MKKKMNDSSDQFYISLMSNASYKNYPANLTTSFTTDLAQPVSLSGEWRVALAQLHYQHTLENVTDGNNKVTVTTPGDDYIFEIPEGHYSNLNEIVDAVNTNVKFRSKKDFTTVRTEIFFNEYGSELRKVKRGSRVKTSTKSGEQNDGKARSISRSGLFGSSFMSENFDLETIPDEDEDGEDVVEGVVPQPQALKRVSGMDMEMINDAPMMKSTINPASRKIFNFHRDIPGDIEIKFNGRLATQFGYEPDTDIVKNLPTHFPSIHFGYPQEILVYSDLIEPQIYGDVHGQILRTVPALTPGTRYGDVVEWSFNVPHYMRVLRREFRSVHIELRTSTGVLAPFGFGNSHLLLHFKRF